MKNYRQFIRQLPNSTVVCAVGDFSPPTTSHEMLIKSVKVVAENNKADHIVFTSPSDTLEEEKKQHYLKMMFPKTNFMSIEESFENVVKKLSEKYKKVIVVAGSNQFDSLKESCEVITIRDKDPDADASKMKQYATKGIYEEFKKHLPSNIRDIDGRRLMNEMRFNLNLEPIKEQIFLVKDELREKYFRGEIYNVGDIVESGSKQYEIVKRGSNHLLLKEETGELVSKWIQDVKLIEAVIQPNGTDKIETNQPETSKMSDTPPKPKGKVRGFLTFYNYDDNKRTIREQQYSTKDRKKDNESDLDTLEDMIGLDPSQTGSVLVKADASHKLRRMKIRHHLGEQIIGTQHTGSMHHTRTSATDKFHDKEAKAKIKATMALKHAREKETLSHKQQKEKEALQNEAVIKFKNKPEKDTKADQDCSHSGNKNAVGGENTKTFSENQIQIPKDAPSVESIANKHKVSVKEIEQQLAIGMKVEAEHGKNPGSEREIALDHLNEKPDYYKKLKKFVEGLEDACWKGYTAVGMKKKNGKKVPNCVPVSEEVEELDETKRMSAAVKLQRAFEREQQKSAASRERAKKLLNPTQDRPGIGTENNAPRDPFFKEEEEFDLSDDDINKMVESVTDEQIEDLYEENEVVLVYEDTGEEVEEHPDECQIDLMEVLSRQERMKGKIRLRKTSAKRSRSTKIALKRYSNPQTVNKRARRLAIKLMKKRLLRGRDPSKVSVSEKERIERIMAKRKDMISRVAMKLVPRIRKIEKSRMSHGKVTKGAPPSVF